MEHTRPTAASTASIPQRKYKAAVPVGYACIYYLRQGSRGTSSSSEASSSLNSGASMLSCGSPACISKASSLCPPLLIYLKVRLYHNQGNTRPSATDFYISVPRFPSTNSFRSAYRFRTFPAPHQGRPPAEVWLQSILVEYNRYITVFAVAYLVSCYGY